MLADYAIQMDRALGNDLAGIYLYGSVASEGYVPGSSDVDVVVLLGSDLNEGQRGALAAAHEHLIRDHPSASVLDVSFAPRRLAGLAGEASLPYFRDGAFHRSGGGDVNVAMWKGLRECGVTMRGRLARDVVPPVGRNELDAEMRRNLIFLRRRMPGYALSGVETTVFGILSLCRVLYTLRTGELIGKSDAARWAMHSCPPRWHTLIRNALWRHEDGRFSGIDLLLRTQAIAFSRAVTHQVRH